MEYPVPVPQPKPLQSFIDVYLERLSKSGGPKLRELNQQVVTVAWQHQKTYGETMEGVEYLADYLRELQSKNEDHPYPYAFYEKAINTLANPKGD